MLFASSAWPLNEVTIPEEVHYSLDWWVSKSGEISKIYEVSYSGQSTIQRLKTFSNSDIQSYIRKILPGVETTDLIQKSEKVSEYHYIFVFKGASLYVGDQAKIALPLFIPVYEDPVSTYLNQKTSSKLHYSSSALKIENRISYRMPWKLDQTFFRKISTLHRDGATVDNKFNVLSSPAIKFTELPGFDQNGAEYVQTITSTDADINMKSREADHVGDLEWPQLRNQPATLFQIPETTSGHPNVNFLQWGGALNFLGARNVQTTSEYVTGYDAELDIFKFRQWTKNFGWRVIDFKITSGSGNGTMSSWYMNSESVGTGIVFRQPFVTPGPDSSLGFIEVVLTPAYGVFRNNFLGTCNDVTAPMVEGRFRIGLSQPYDHFLTQLSLDLYMTSYLTNKMPAYDGGGGLVVAW